MWANYETSCYITGMHAVAKLIGFKKFESLAVELSYTKMQSSICDFRCFMESTLLTYIIAYINMETLRDTIAP